MKLRIATNIDRLALLLVSVLTLLLSGCGSTTATITPISDEAGATGIRGQVLDPAGQPLSGAYVYAYRSARGGLRGPADFAAQVDANGDYFLDLVEGTYHLAARWRKTGADEGPPRVGDAWSVFPRNPVSVRPARTAHADFVLSVQNRTRIAREGSLTSGDTGFRGRLIDSAGSPVVGAFALAYRQPDFRRIPDYTSLPADADGTFTLYLPDAGRWCLAARNETRGQPRAGEPYGRLGEGDDACRELKFGEIVDVGEILMTSYRR